MSKTIKILLIVLGVLIIGGGGAYVYFKVIKKPASTPTPTPSVSTTKSTTPSPAISTVVDPGVSWITPQVLGDLKLLKIGEDSGLMEAKYYKVANLNGSGEIILAKVTYEGPGFPAIFRFKKNEEGKYAYLVKHSAEKEYSQFSKYLAEGVLEDYNTIYQSLSAPDFISIRNTTLKYASSEGLFEDLGQNNQPKPKEVGETAYGKFYETQIRGDSTEVGGIIYDLKLADSSYKGYIIKFDFVTDDEKAQVTWSDGSKNSAKYTPESYVGCAMTASLNVVLNTDNLADRLEAGGKTNAGEDIYLVTKEDDPIIKAAYENYKIGREKDVLSLSDFHKKKPVFVFKSGLGVNIIFTGRDYAGLAECGKPAIYLYPEQEMEVFVKLGTKITKSDPEYKDGWKVWALPSGELKFGDKTYPYLYWEGTGQEYALINAGAVVAKKDVEKTLKMQMQELGLNEKEIADFLDFWLPKMPNKPFVRLTWFGNQLMDRLAPISVTPKPETIIRVFLDYEGLDIKISLPAQRLSAPLRKGFTVVEWGGLLRK